MKKYTVFGILLISLLAQACLESATKPVEEYYTADDYAKVPKIDAHVHILTSDSSFILQSKEDGFRLLDINVDAPSVRPWPEQQAIAIKHMQIFGKDSSMAWACTFSVKNWNDDNWTDQTIASIKDSYSKGAIAIKIWKNVGMDLRGKDGKLVMIDNPRFDSVLDFIAQNNMTLIGHFGEPKNCWQPLDSMTVNDYKHYYKANPQFHMYLHPGITTYEEQVAARDHMLEKHPNLRFVGAHLGSLEWSLDELAKRLDKFPKMSVDMAERVSHFELDAMHDWQKTRDFMIKYADRLLYGTDIIVWENNVPAEMKQQAHETRYIHWKFFVTDEKLTSSSVDGEFKGLKLPKDVVDKIFYKNAQRYFAGL